MGDKISVLLSNDDGFHAEGLQTLYKYLAPVAEVTIVAPDRERSAVGHGITMHQPLRAILAPIADSQHWMVNGTPSDCIKLAMEHLLERASPDLLISGINRGPNFGNDILYSGTVAAALEGVTYQIPSIAASLAAYGQSDFNPAAQFIRDNLSRLAELAKKATLNLNFPPGKIFNGVKFTRLGKRFYNNVFEERRDPRGQSYFWMAGEPAVYEQTIDSDIRAIEEDFISITPLNPDFTNYQFLKELTGEEFFNKKTTI